MMQRTKNFIDRDCLTPIMDKEFKFPPNISMSVDRFPRKQTNNNYFDRMSLHGRSFTPHRNALFLNSPEASPIEPIHQSPFAGPVIRLPKEAVQLEFADSTVLDQSCLSKNGNRFESSVVKTIHLMPPPPNRKTSSSRHRRTLPANFSPAINLNERLSVHKILSDIGLSKYIGIFEEQEIDLDTFIILEDADLQKIGVENIQARQAILYCIKYDLGL